MRHQLFRVGLALWNPSPLAYCCHGTDQVYHPAFSFAPGPVEKKHAVQGVTNEQGSRVEDMQYTCPQLRMQISLYNLCWECIFQGHVRFVVAMPRHYYSEMFIGWDFARRSHSNIEA